MLCLITNWNRVERERERERVREIEIEKMNKGFMKGRWGLNMINFSKGFHNCDDNNMSDTNWLHYLRTMNTVDLLPGTKSINKK